MKTVAIIGASGGIGKAIVAQYATRDSATKIFALSRSGNVANSKNITPIHIDTSDEASIEAAVSHIKEHATSLDEVIVATGMLHDDVMMPEKSLKELSRAKFEQLFLTNTIGPALVMKHFTPLLSTESKSIFAAISARVGSISDNHLGGWYAYRASKAALNMLIKSTSIEVARKNKHAIIVGLHPGTVDSDLSKPFQQHVKPEKLFTADYSASFLIDVLEELTPEQTGKLFAYDGEEIQP